MSIGVIIFFVIGGLIICAQVFLLVLELWKKLWLITPGEVVSAKLTNRYSQRRENSISVTIGYRYVVKGMEYHGEEIKVLDVQYHEEAEAMKSLHQQFPVGEKIAIFYPKSVPMVSSITPGGAGIPKLVTWALLTPVCLYGIYMYATAGGER
jgi:hypothetical protein